MIVGGSRAVAGGVIGPITTITTTTTTATCTTAVRHLKASTQGYGYVSIRVPSYSWIYTRGVPAAVYGDAMW